MKINILAAIAAMALVAQSAQATSINVLWTSGTADYNADITTLASEAATFDPASDGSVSWNLTLWDGSAVNFSDYDVMVVGSSCDYSTDQTCGNAPGFFGNGVDVSGVFSNRAAIEAARGNRTFLSGQDADFHYAFDATPGPFVDDGPKGFLINAVNWAASGTGMGIVSMVDRINNDDGWWTANGSFLKDELGTSPFHYGAEDVDIGAGQSGFPINEGLTDAGLSNWGTSSHACFGNVDDYLAINVAGATAGPQAGCSVTIVTESEADGGTSPVVPLPAGAWLMLSGLAGFAAMKRRKA